MAFLVFPQGSSCSQNKSSPTSVVPVVLLSTASLLVLSIVGPVGHTTELVALGEGSIWDTIANRLSGDWGSP